MEKKVGLFFVVLLVFLVFLIPLIFSDDNPNSINEANIIIYGCTVDNIGFKIGECYNNRYFCYGHQTPLSVFSEPNACTYKKNNIVDDQVCCPSGTHSCRIAILGDDKFDPNNPNDYYCFPAKYDCSYYKDKPDCIKDNFHGGQCYWTETDGGKCVPKIDSCYLIKDDTTCNNADEVAKNDVNCRHGEYIVSGDTYVISEDSCKCVWDNGECTLQYKFQDVYGKEGYSNFKTSTCTYRLIEDTNGCVDGSLKYTYAATYVRNNIPSSVLDGDTLCFNREGARACGQPVIKLPFFNLFNVIFVILLIFVFYLSQTKFFKRKKK